MSPAVVDPPWGFVEWALTSLGGAATATGILLWRIGVIVGKMTVRIESMEKKQAVSDEKIASLELAEHTIEKSIAELPDKIAQRFDQKFDALTGRIDGLFDNLG